MIRMLVATTLLWPIGVAGQTKPSIPPAAGPAGGASAAAGYGTRFGDVTVNVQGMLGVITAYDQVRSSLTIPPNSTTNQSSAIAGYVENYKPSATGTQNLGAGVALWGQSRNMVDGARSWGMSLLVQDTPADVGTGEGQLVLNEIDMGADHASTQVIGLSLTAGFSVQPKNADGYIIGSFNPANIWINGFRTFDGAASTAFLAGQAGASGAQHVTSQPIKFRSSGTAQHDVYIYGYDADQLVVDGDVPTLLRTNDGMKGIQVGALGKGNGTGSQPLLFVGRNASGAQLTGTVGLDGAGRVVVNGVPMPMPGTPVSSTAPCVAGQQSFDANYLYVCVSQNT